MSRGTLSQNIVMYKILNNVMHKILNNVIDKICIKIQLVLKIFEK